MTIKEEEVVLIFHRSKNNREEDLANQNAFLETYKEQLGNVRVIDYMSGDSHDAYEVMETLKRNSKPKAIVIMQSYLPRKDYETEYNIYNYLRALERVDRASIFLMDSDGKVYGEKLEPI